MRNLRSSIKVALDFVSPDAVYECLTLRGEFRYGDFVVPISVCSGLFVSAAWFPMRLASLEAHLPSKFLLLVPPA